MYTPSKHVNTFHIAGFQHYEGAFVLDQLKPGTKLRIEAEPDNPYDPNAMALYLDSNMLGHIPKGEGGLMSLMHYYGHTDVFEAVVVQVNPEADPWKQVRVGIYITDNR